MNEKSAILEELARSRVAIRRDTALVQHELDFAAKARESVRRRPFAWLAGASALGYIFAGPKTRTKTVTKVVRGKGKESEKPKAKAFGFLAIFLAIIRFVLPFAKPALSAYAARRVGEFAQRMVK